MTINVFNVIDVNSSIEVAETSDVESAIDEKLPAAVEAQVDLVIDAAVDEKISIAVPLSVESEINSSLPQAVADEVADAAISSGAGGHEYSGNLISTAKNAGNYGTYDSTKVDTIWSMGTNFKVDVNGDDLGNLYGAAYYHTNNPSESGMAGGHQFLWCQNGTPYCSLGNHLWTRGSIYEQGELLSQRYLGSLGSAASAKKVIATAGRVSVSNSDLENGEILFRKFNSTEYYTIGMSSLLAYIVTQIHN